MIIPVIIKTVLLGIDIKSCLWESLSTEKITFIKSIKKLLTPEMPNYYELSTCAACEALKDEFLRDSNPILDFLKDVLSHGQIEYTML